MASFYGAYRLEHVERLFVEVAGDFGATCPGADAFVLRDRGGESGKADARKPGGLFSCDFLGGGLVDPLFGFGKCLQERGENGACDEFTRSAKRAEGIRGHGSADGCGS